MRWQPPWVVRSALGAPPARFRHPMKPELAARRAAVLEKDRALAQRVAEVVRANKQAGRPFYVGIPEEFERRFRKAGRGIYRTYAHSKQLTPQTRADGFPADEESRERDIMQIVNKTYFNALRGIEDYRADAGLNTWFRVIAHNVAVDQLRERTRIPAVRESWLAIRKSRSTDQEAASVIAAQASKLSKSGGVSSMAAPEEEVFGKRRSIRESIKEMIEKRNPQTGDYVISNEADRALLSAFANSGFDAAKTVSRVRGYATPAAALARIQTVLADAYGVVVPETE